MMRGTIAPSYSWLNLRLRALASMSHENGPCCESHLRQHRTAGSGVAAAQLPNYRDMMIVLRWSQLSHSVEKYRGCNRGRVDAATSLMQQPACLKARNILLKSGWVALL